MINSDLSKPQNANMSSVQQQSFHEVRKGVKELLSKSRAFRSLSPQKQREIAKNTVEVVQYLAAPEGIPGNKLPTAHKMVKNASGGEKDNYAFEFGEARQLSDRNKGFKAEAAREGAEVAGILLQAVNFPEFVSGLIEGVFTSIVDSTIRQMEAYGKLVADVAKSLNQFRDENVTDNQGRDYIIEQNPDLFDLEVDTGEWSEGGGGPRVRLREGVDESAALQRINNLPIEGGPLKSLDLEDEETERKIVQAARTQLATSRQQLLATMVLMGINRIIVTDGRISAKVMYDFRAQEKFRRSATAFDYQQFGTKTTSEGEYERDYQGGEYTSSSKDSGWESQRRGPNYYARGEYKTTQEPSVKITSATAETTDASLATKASLAGSVEVNFKSETFPLEKMADSFQIGRIQNASRPRRAQASESTQPATPA